MIKFKRLTIALLALLSISATAWAASLEGRTFVDFKIEFRENPYTVLAPQSGNLPTGVSVEGPIYNGNQHGVKGGTITVPVDGPVKFTIGGCQFSTTDITIKKDGQAFTTVSNNVTTCGENIGNFAKYVTYEYNGEADTLTFELGTNTYMPYFFAEAVEPSIEVTLNEAKTEATFSMPQYDVTATYTLKRDMTVDMAVSVQDAEQNSRFRVQKQGNVFVPVGLTLQQVAALFNVHDDIESKDLAATDYSVQIFAADDEGQPTDTAMTFQKFTFAPGRYVAIATAADSSNYSGTTAPSNIFTLFEGYEVTVPAGEYITYYQNEKLKVEDEAAQLYTISSVTDTEAVLSNALTVAPAETPLLVYNKSEQDKTFLLIPTTDDADEVTAASQFKGTLEPATIAASTTSIDNYALNGKAFVWVKYAIEIGANKCWLQIGDQPAAARAMTRSITGGGDTTNMDDVRWQMEDGNYYDLQGRKVEKPNRKGIYIKGGKKVIFK